MRWSMLFDGCDGNLISKHDSIHDACIPSVDNYDSRMNDPKVITFTIRRFFRSHVRN